MGVDLTVKFACGHTCVPACTICSQELSDSHEPAIKSLNDVVQRLREALERIADDADGCDGDTHALDQQIAKKALSAKETGG
jgi:hypothetical protein